MSEAKERLSFAALREANAARQKLWDSGNQITLAYRGNELAGEVGEACNVIKKLARERLGIRGSRDTLAHLAEELADVVICVDLIAMSEGIDLAEAVAAKFNATSEKVGLPTRLPAPDGLARGGERPVARITAALMNWAVDNGFHEKGLVSIKCREAALAIEAALASTVPARGAEEAFMDALDAYRPAAPPQPDREPADLSLRPRGEDRR